MLKLLVAVLVTLALSACHGSPSADLDTRQNTAPAPADVALPPSAGRFDYQLGTAYEPDDGLDVVVRDATAEPAAGAYSICYVNGFQTQPGQAGLWLDGNRELLLHDAAGELVVDPDWPDEYVLDPSTGEKRGRILGLLGPVITGCADSGFDAVEIDNLDTWTRFTEPGTGVVEQEDALALAGSYVDHAHEAGLAVGQKNAAEAAATGRELGFDFAVTEECAAYDECGAYTGVYGDNVLQIEYTDNLPESFADVCSSAARAPLTILRDRDLVGPGDAAYGYRQCGPR